MVVNQFNELNTDLNMLWPWFLKLASLCDRFISGNIKELSVKSLECVT